MRRNCLLKERSCIIMTRGGAPLLLFCHFSASPRGFTAYIAPFSLSSLFSSPSVIRGVHSSRRARTSGRGRRQVSMHIQHKHRSLQSKLAGHPAFKASIAHQLLKKTTGGNRENGEHTRADIGSRLLLRAASVYFRMHLHLRSSAWVTRRVAKDALKFATSVLLPNVAPRGDCENRAVKKTLA